MTDLAYRSPRTELRPSPIHGLGLFARTAIARGEIVAVKGGYILDRRAWARIEPALGPAEIQVTEDLVIAPVHPDERPGAMLHTNHSCEPNIAIQGQIVFVAMRDIAPGEELTHDWATTDDQDYAMACRCGAPRSRDCFTGSEGAAAPGRAGAVSASARRRSPGGRGRRRCRAGVAPGAGARPRREDHPGGAARGGGRR